jgi:hypothetical protein
LKWKYKDKLENHTIIASNPTAKVSTVTAYETRSSKIRENYTWTLLNND